MTGQELNKVQDNVETAKRFMSGKEDAYKIPSNKSMEELKEAKIDLDKTHENTVEMVKKSAHTVVEDYNKSGKLQKKLNDYCFGTR